MPDKIQDKRKRLYDALVAADYDAGADFNDFNNLMDTDEVARQWVYDTAKSEGWKVGDNFEQFVGYITPAQEVDKSQYTFTAEQLEDNAYEAMKGHAASPQMPVGSATLPTENRTREELLAERKRLEDAKREAELRLRTRRGEIASPSGMYQMGMAPVTGNQAAEITDPEMTKLYAAVNSYDNAIRSVDRKLSGEEPGFWEGVADATVRNPGFYTMGLTDMSDARGMLNIAQNGIEERGDELLADAIYSKNAEQQDEDFGFLYRAGNMFGHSVPFMVQTAVTGGFSGASKAGANLAGRLGKKAAEGTIKKKIINAMGTTIDDVIEAGLIANTAGAGGTWANIAERKAGKINIKDGDYVFENGESWLGALYKGEVSSILELYTEKLGGHLEGKLSLTKGLDKIGASRVSNVLLAAKNSDLYKGASTVMRQFGLNGYLPEVLEEEANLVLNSLLVGDNSLSELYNPKTQLDIFGGMLLTVGTMQAIPGTIATAGYVKNQYQMNRADRRAADVFGEDWEAVKEALDNATNEKVAGVVSDNLRDNENQNKALLDYYKRMMIMRGYNIGTVKNETAPDIEEAYTDGFSQEPTGANALNAITGYDIAKQEVARALGLAEGDDVDVFLNGRTAEDIAKGDTDVENAVKNYQQQKARMEGIQEKFQQTREQQYEESDKSIQANDNNGMVYATQLKDDPVFITGGNVALNEDGTIDVNNSSETLYVKFPDGHVEMTSPDKFTEVFTSDRTADLKAAKRAEIDAKWKAEFDAAEAQSIEQEKREAGVVFDKADAQGNHRIEILNEGEDMSNILFDGAETEIPTEELNRWKQEAGIQSTDTVADNATDNGTPTESEANVAPTGDNVAPVETAAPKTALEQIPRNEKNVPLYEQVNSELAWDGVVEEAGGNEETAMLAVNSMIADKQDALKMAEKAKAKAGVTIAEKIAAENERVANIEKAKADLAKWQEIAGVKAKRAAAQAENVAQPVEEKAIDQTAVEPVQETQNRELFDNQGNPIDENGRLIVEEVATIDDITDADFDAPVRNVQLPLLPENVATAIGTNGKPVVIKKNVFEKNGNTHVELDPADSREILKSALYNPNIVGATQPIKRPDYKVAIRTGEKNAVVVLDVFQGKDHVEIVGWRQVNEKGLAKMQRQAEREGGQFLILSPNDGSAAALSALPFGLSSESEGRNIVSNEQENLQKSGEKSAKNGNNELNLQKENESDNESNQNDISVGGQVSQSVPQGEYGTQASQVSGAQEVAARLRERIESAQGDSKSGLLEVENRVTREFAQENGLWIENETELGTPFPSGDEHNNYIDAENQVVYKVNNRMHTPSILDLLDRIEQHNKYFPDSKYSLVGFTSVSKNGDVLPVFAQDFVSDARMATNEEIDSYMGTLGFTRVGDGRYSNDEVVIKDLKPRNVLADADGDIYVVDAEFEQEKQSTQSVGEQVQAAEAEDELDVYLAEMKAAQERQKAFAQKSPRPSSFVEAYTANDAEVIKRLDKQFNDALQTLAPLDIPAIETTIKGMKDRKSTIKAGSANERMETPAYKAFDHIEKALAKRKKQLEKELTEDDKRRLDIIKRGNRGELKETPQPKQENKPVESEPIKDEAPVTSETTEQPETGEVADAGPVNMETLQLNMSEEDFNALLNSGDKAAISEYLAEMDGALRIDENSPFAGQVALREEYSKAVEQYGKENIPAEVMDDLNSRMQPYSDLSRAIFDRKYALQDKLREIEVSEAQAKEQAEKEAKAEHKQTAFGGFLAGKTDLGASAAEKALNKKYNFDGKVMTVAEFVEEAVANGNAKLSTIEEPKYKGASRAAWNRMDAKQQEADAKRVKESGTKTVYTVNDHDLGKTAYDYAKFLLDKKAEQEKAAAKQKVKDAIEQFAKEKAAEQAPIKIEDVGEKIGGAKKDRFAEGIARIKAELEETDETLTDKLAKLPVSQVFNFDLEKLREGGISNEAISFIKIVKDYLPAKPRKTYKIRSWVNNTLALYKLCLEAGTNWDRVNTLLNGPQFTSSSLKEQFDAYMAIGGFDSGMNIGDAKLRQLDNKSGRYDENGKFVTLAGKWYVRDAGNHGGIYDTKEEAVNALKAFAGDKAGVTSSGKKKEVKFAVYQRRQDKSIFIAVKGKSDIVIQDGFKSSKEAFDYIEANNAELQERYRALLDKTNADFEDNRPREGRDYRDGKDIPAEEFRTTFGFRGVEFGNWMTQEDRRKALNECYDALMDLAAVCKVSPQALSLGGTLGMAFGARGGGRFSAHYEPGKLVINLTKTKGAGSLAHEWFHALDNYFAKMGSEGLDVYATAGEGLFPEGISSIGKRYYDRKSGQMLTEEEYNERMNSHEVRREMADAWKSLMETLKKSDYYKRSLAYAGLHNSNYWSRPTELGARAFSTWVENELSKQGASNDYLANNPRFLVSEATDEQSRFMPYPFDADATWMEEAFGNLFEVMQEKTTEDGKAVLYSIAEDAMLQDRGTEAFERATKVTMDAVERLKANGLDIEVVSQEEADAMAELAEAQNAEMQTSKEIEAKYPDWLEGTTTESGKHSTQVEGTRKTYKKVGDWIDENMGKDVAILDASSGMGYGTADLRERGFNIEDVEPYQSEDRKQNNPATYSSYSDIEKQYDYIISNAVLNVIPDDWRTDVLHNMADKLKDGGRLFINTRKAGEERFIKDKIELDSPQEVLVKRNGRIASYQRFFTPQELKEWVESELGDGYTVEIANKANSGTNGLAAVVVTKKNESPANGKTSELGQPILKKKNAPLANVAAKVSKNAERASRLDAIISSIEKIGEMGPHEFLHEVVNAMLLSQDMSTKKSRYAKLGGGVTLRLANHYGNAETFKEHKDQTENYGLVIKLSNNPFKPDKDVDYLEYVYFPDKLTKERQIEIAKGLKAFMEMGRYDLLPKPDKVNPSGKFVGRTELSTTDGKVYGWAVDGKIRLTPDGINPNTPVHEYAHLWGADVEKNNPKLWNEVVEAMKLSPVWNEVANDANYSNIHGNDSRMASEVLARLSGRENYRRTMEEAQREIEQAKTIEEKAEKISRWAKIKAALKNLWNWVQRNVFRSGKRKDESGQRSAELMPWEEFANSVVGDFYKGKNPNVKESPLEGMFVGENSAEMQEGEARFRTVEETSDGSIDDVPAQPLTLMERITNSLLEVSAKNKENLGLRADALRTFGRDINRVLSLMKAQKEYDKSTVDTLVKLAKMYFKNAQLLGEVDTYTMGRVLSLINNVVGKRDVTASAAKLMDILLDAHTNALAGILDKAEKVKAKKVNAAGVEVMGRLDKYGQRRVDEYRAAKEMTPEKLEEAIYDSDNRLAELEQRVREALNLAEGDDVDLAAKEYTGDNDVVNVYMDERARLEGLTLAREYKESIQQVQEEIKDLKRELKQAEEDYRLGNIDGKSLKEFRKSVAEAIMESKAGLIEGYHSLIYKFQENTKESSKRAKEFAQAQIDRAREIQHNANSDMEGISADTQGTHPDNYNNAVMNALRSPFPTFQGMLKKFGEKNVEGKGYLYERFMPQATKASDNEFRGKVTARVMIEAKLKEIYGEKANIAEFMKELREYGTTVTYREGNEMKQFDLTKGQMLYIYMVNKMSDGQMKLRRMGITDDVVAELMVKLPEEAVQFADWAQNELLKDLRGKYNAVHERVFGAPMAAIENYFPIKIRKEARGEKGDVSEVGQEGKPSTVTGSIIKRTKNAIAIDLSADAMQVLMEHIDDMEHWAAFAEFNRDLNVLLNYKHFQNQVKNMTSVRYGSGEEMWKNFKKTAQIVSGTYRPSDSSIDRAVLNIAKGLTRSKINFRLYTAIKQLLSAPAFWTDAGVKELAYCYVNPKGSFDWAKENLPGFAERWQGRTMGNEKLLKSDSDWELWRNEFVEKATRWGITPNAAIDALTVAQGARAVYMTKLEQFKKAGYTEQRANEKALQAAAEAYNESQQSSEGIYLSPLQVEGTAKAAAFTTFKNSNFGYTRKTAQAIANIKRKMRKGYKEETIAFMTKQMIRDGLSEADAKKMAEKVYNKSKYKDVANVAMFGFGLNLLWEAGGMAIYLLLGDDDEEKEKMMKEIALRGSLGLLNGVPFGETMISAAMAVKEGDTKYFRLPELVAVSDIKNLAQVLNYDPVRGANDIVNMLISMGVGVTPQVLTDILVAFGDVEEFSAEELGMFVARFVNAPQSNLDRLMVDDAMENSAINAEEITRRYAEYKKSKNAPITQFFYPEEGEKKVIERYEKRFEKLLDERLENVVEDNDAYDLFYKGADARRKSELAKMRQKYLAEDKAKALEKLDSKELVDMVWNSTKETNKDINEEYFNLTNAEDEDTAFIIKIVKKALDDLKEGGKLSDKERGLLLSLNRLNYAINNAKSLMERQPERAQERMNNIRELRAKAIELINNYRNNE